MSHEQLIATAWNNGTHRSSGAGYGLKISRDDRDRYLDPAWATVDLHIPGLSAAVPVSLDKASMWTGNCRELIHEGIGLWLRNSGVAPWPKGRPPRVRLSRIGERAFELSLV